MPKDVCVCIKNDEHGENACKDASCDPAVWGFVCHNECVVEMVKRLKRETEARIAAEERLKKYRDAIKPFVNNCRAVIAAVDEKDGEQ